MMIDIFILISFLSRMIAGGEDTTTTTHTRNSRGIGGIFDKRGHSPK
jgi:hypothetical protein